MRMDKNASINLESYQKFVKTIQPAVGTEKNLKASSVTSLPTNCEKVKTTEKVEDVTDCGQTKDDILELIGNCSLDEEHKGKIKCVLYSNSLRCCSLRTTQTGTKKAFLEYFSYALDFL